MSTRILVDLSEDTLKELDAMAEASGQPRAHLLRRAVQKLLSEEKFLASSKQRSVAFGLWKAQPMTDEELLAIKDEWNEGGS